jgi:putative membrane-bound dehydrogenase-like protein
MQRKVQTSPGVVFILVLAACASAGLPPTTRAAAPIPHGQTRPPGDPLTPDQAIRRMTVPDGFHVELVASEPDIVNPVAMTFDERGRVWITESLEYPRRSPGAGRDRVKVLEDTDGDGRADKFTVFADGLNIPSGIAVGHGGVWVANAPDILFLQDTDGDGRADRREVVVTGFGRSDTHELPNSLTWGPDGWLYGWNGVFNPSRIDYRGKRYDFTCAIFRIHPRSRDFEVFCEGTSNPWGIAWDPEGSAFASACVIDHLWHLTETGYYHRQGGPYPPFTWKIESIVDHTHQKAAYCGIHYYDSDAYPPEYRNRLYMGNIHGNAINVDLLERNGSTYKAKAAPDFLAANDAWFMPVSQKTGPDGCLYILDWYDQYHCYQDANRDPAGIDRLKGRLYRVRYKDAPRRSNFDLGKKPNVELIDLLSSPNAYDRETASRLLAERTDETTYNTLEAIVGNRDIPRRTRLNALWAMLSGRPLDTGTVHSLLDDPDPTFRAWGVRAVGNARTTSPELRDRLLSMAHDRSPDVRLQVAIASRKVEGIDPIPVLLDVLAASDNDPLIPRIVWQNLHPLLEEGGGTLARLITPERLDRSSALITLIPRAVDRLLGGSKPDPSSAVALVADLDKVPRAASIVARMFQGLAERIQSGELAGVRLDTLRQGLQPIVSSIFNELVVNDRGAHLSEAAAILASSWKDPVGIGLTRETFRHNGYQPALRVQALNALIAAGDTDVLGMVAPVLADRKQSSTEFRGQVLAGLGRLDDPKVAEIVLADYPEMESDLRPKAVELLTQRTPWSLALLDAIGRGKISADALNVNQVRKLLASKDGSLVQQVKARWGTVREGRNPAREAVIARMRTFLDQTPGDPVAGRVVFKNLCAQCHTIHGEGQDVGPDLTSNGRGSYEQLLSNVLDPSLVIGPSYQATTVATSDGRVITGLVAEDGPRRVVLKTQGGKLETIPREDVEELKVSPLSLMPEGLETQLKPQEIADLFAFLSLERPPEDPSTRPIPGARALAPRK